MNEIISNITIGVIFAFCALTAVLLLWPDNDISKPKKRKKKKQKKQVDAPVNKEKTGE